MDSDKYLKGQSMQRPPLFESDHFIYWKNRFETYVKAKDLDLWHIILNGDFPSIAKNEITQISEVVPFKQQDGDLKRKLAKNNEAKMVLYNALPKKEYERIFMCKTAKDIWKSLLITHPRFGVNNKMTNPVPAPPMDPPNTRGSGFAAVLAVLVTGASQSRQHGKSESDSYYLSD
ncbi:hypothetical protein Tco_0938390 [Tanacetum coccineum]|uniref:DUF4219 domain-containing protein n=1 Tax=Tanacetum coccineum TaxID=301880 RepID=A0ABQ5DH10_9ASTR